MSLPAKYVSREKIGGWALSHSSKALFGAVPLLRFRWVARNSRTSFCQDCVASSRWWNFKNILLLIFDQFICSFCSNKHRYFRGRIIFCVQTRPCKVDWLDFIDASIFLRAVDWNSTRNVNQLLYTFHFLLSRTYTGAHFVIPKMRPFYRL